MNAIEKIHGFQRFGSILGLERMTKLLELLGNPQDDLKVIHVAGTNGKGSVSRYIYSCLEAVGYKTGLYTSPFLEIFNERIEVGGSYISDEDLAIYTDRVLEKVQIITDRGEQSPTEFEVITAIAFLYFKEQCCDYVVLEVGLGGRGDSTNVCQNPLATVITTISYDHMDRLGSSLAEIAGEKAGIIKEGCPLIMGVENEEARQVILAAANEKHAPVGEAGNVKYKVREQGLWGSRFSVKLPAQGILKQPHAFKKLEISMAGEHQIKNAITALMTLAVIEERNNLSISSEAVYEGFKKAKQPGRLELMTEINLKEDKDSAIAKESKAIIAIKALGALKAIDSIEAMEAFKVLRPAEKPETCDADKEPIIIIDGAHNEDGAKALAQAMDRYCNEQRILMVTGMLADKDVDGILNHFTSITNDFLVTELDNPRRLTADALALKIQEKGGNCIGSEPDIAQICHMALEKGKEYDIVLFAGSLYMIGTVRTIINRKKGRG